MSLLDGDGITLDLTVPVVIVGGGACGLVAALSARDAGARVVVLERDRLPQGSTALSSGMITACGTALQRAVGILDDTADLFAADIQAKTNGRAPAELLQTVCETSGQVIDWLVAAHAMDLVLVEGAPYPGHSRQRTHAPPRNSGVDLMADLLRAAEAAGVEVMTNATVSDLIVTDDRITGVQVRRPDNSLQQIGCQALVLASSGFGGNPHLIRQHLPQMAGAIYFGHEGNKGDAVLWGQALGANCHDMGSFQGHGSVATPHVITVSWALLNQGGILINRDGKRFADESAGASELATTVCGQPGGSVWAVVDQRLHDGALRFPDYRTLHDLGAIRSGGTAADLARACDLPVDAVLETLAAVTDKPVLQAPYYAIQVTGALLQTQGGLAVNNKAGVIRPDGSALPGLFAGGGAAQGLSGPDGTGYLSCNGLLSAVTLGYIAGREAAAHALVSV
jgi:fumarate reductase flavoprotein subunit